MEVGNAHRKMCLVFILPTLRSRNLMATCSPVSMSSANCTKPCAPLRKHKAQMHHHAHPFEAAPRRVAPQLFEMLKFSSEKRMHAAAHACMRMRAKAARRWVPPVEVAQLVVTLVV